MSVRDELAGRLVQIPGVIRHPSPKGHGDAFFAGDREIAHFHGDQRLDVRLTRELIGQRKSEHAFDERVRTRGPSADWVAVRIAGAQDLPLALSLAEDAVRANAPHGSASDIRGKS
jgi:hypothetical protein